jgi:hypothetical protein
LKQTDFDKKSTYSKIVLVELELGHNPVVIVYPNPATEELFSVQMKGFTPEETVQIKLSDSMGRTVLTDQTRVGASELHEIKISKTGLAPGVYILIVSSRSKKLFSRVVIN